MISKITILLAIFTLLLTSCASAEPTETGLPDEPASATESPTEPLQDSEAEPSPYPPPAVDSSPYPEPTGSDSSSDSASPYPAPLEPPTSGFEPAPGDDQLARSEAFVEFEQSEILILESAPPQINIVLRGYLPDPCHELRVEVSGPNRRNQIYFEVYSVTDTGKACITKIEPFEATIPLGSLPAGSYSIWVNDQSLGEFDV